MIIVNKPRALYGEGVTRVTEGAGHGRRRYNRPQPRLLLEPISKRASKRLGHQPVLVNSRINSKLRRRVARSIQPIGRNGSKQSGNATDLFGLRRDYFIERPPSTDVRNAFLGLFIGCCNGLSRKLEHRCFLTFS